MTETDTEFNPFQLAFKTALDVKKDSRVDPNLREVIVENLGSPLFGETVMQPGELDAWVDKSRNIGFEWSNYFNLSTNFTGKKVQKQQLSSLQSSFEKLAHTVAGITLNQGAELVYSIVEGMGLESRKNHQIFTRSLYREMLKNPNIFTGLNSIPQWRVLSIHTYFLVGLIIMSGYNQTQIDFLYDFIKQKTESVGVNEPVSIPYVLAEWIKKERNVI